MTHQALTYLLQSRENRGKQDHFTRDVILCGLVLWLVIILVALRHVADASFVRGSAQVVLSMVSTFLIISLPVRQLQRDSAIHASLYGGRCYDEVLGTMISPREIVDQIAFHSVTRCLRSSAPWVALIAGLWCLSAPQWFLQVLLFALAWFPVAAAFILPTSYLAQQLAIYNSQLKSGAASSLFDSVFALVTAGPMGLLILSGLVALVLQYFTLVLAFALAYLVFGVLVSRALATTGIERLPKLNESVQALSRKWLGVRRNPCVVSWSQNPIVVRERARDAGRIPGHFLGALIFQAPLFFTGLLFAWCFDGQEGAFRDDPGSFSTILILCGLVQFVLASRRASGAIVGEVVSQTIEPMQNTRLHAREFLFGWLQVAALPRMVENVLIFLPVYYAFGAASVPIGLAILSGLLFVTTPVVGAALGLLASYAINREKAAKAHSDLMMTTLFGWFVVSTVGQFAISDVPLQDLGGAWVGSYWCAVLLLYYAAVFSCSMARTLQKIEIR